MSFGSISKAGLGIKTSVTISQLLIQIIKREEQSRGNDLDKYTLFVAMGLW